MKVKGRKRHLLVDTLGLLLMVVVHSASIQDRQGGYTVLQRAKAHRITSLQLIWADNGYAGLFAA
jgi:putative transposase